MSWWNRESRGGHTTGSSHGGTRPRANWKCPKCGAVLTKGPSAADLGYNPYARIVGTVTCGECRAQYDRNDVYSGKYDV